MNTEKPKLTEEQVDEILKLYQMTNNMTFKEAFIALGYMEKPETAFERAEREYRGWYNSYHSPHTSDGVTLNGTIEVLEMQRAAIKELTEKIEKLEAWSVIVTKNT